MIQGFPNSSQPMVDPQTGLITRPWLRFLQQLLTAAAGPETSTDNAIARFDGTTGELQNSGITIADGASGTLAGSNSGDVSLAGTPDYLTLAAQILTLALIDLTTDVTGDLPYANLQPATAASRLLGRGSAAADGDWEEITVGSNLTMTGTTLSSVAGGITQLTGNVTAGPGSGSQAATIADAAVTYARIQDISAASRLLGRGSAGGSGDTEEISVGTGLTMTGTTLAASASAPTESVGITIDGAGSAISTGVKGYVEVPYACTITAVRMFADQSGSAVVDIWKDTYANYPPSNAESITASAEPTITTAVKSEDTTLTGWTTSISAGDILGFNVDSASTITRLTLQLSVTRS
jgi:hypothetical protein